ncbi:MAG: hypothetical protein KDK44_06095 [Chlamydiia bacterium]|nr:hypothetical protein [Chlamydiia bacterium]
MATEATNTQAQEQVPVWGYLNLFLSALLCGPLAVVYLLAQNDKALGRHIRSKQILIWGSLLSLLAAAVVVNLHQGVWKQLPILCIIPGVPLTGLYPLLQGSQIRKMVLEGHKRGPPLKLFCITLISTVLTVAACLAIAFLLRLLNL